MLTPSRSPDLRLHNRETLLRRLFLHAPCSRLDLSQATGLSPGTVTNLVAELLEAGVVLEQGSVGSEGGRPRTLLAPNPDYRRLLGVDLGETHLQMELFDFTLRRLHRVRLSVTNGRPQDYVALIAEALEETLAATGMAADRILGMGVGVPGVVEHDGHVLVSAPLWGWESIPFYAMLRERVAVPFYIDNGAKAMTLAEAWFGAGRGADNLAALLVGTGVGAGIITQGTLYRGATNSAGEWGHTKIVPQGRSCRCGSYGCLESYVGAPGVLQTWQAHDPGVHLPTDQVAGLQAFLGALERGDPGATAALAETAAYLGLGLANLVNLFNPERVVLGGWAGLTLGAYLLEAVRPHLERHVLPPSRKKLDIRLCRFGQDAICTGAACLILDQFFQGNERFR
ncbi:MAG: ROK family transcriptional regulator [Caldilineales bacterium]|nr:ROK family transcriptional regulator [Caldilineales bacterium]MCX7853262.1 ROK family transcriptional regulator [Caldilineales bacterium]MDW8319181.1 ROK family transcriptional regulator [Anaerolineae bacterium]